MKLPQTVFTLCTTAALAALFLPSVTLLYQTNRAAKSQQEDSLFDGTRYILSPSSNVGKQDPLGYSALLRATFFRTVSSYTFTEPSKELNLGKAPSTYDKGLLKSFAQANGVQGTWSSRDVLTREAKAAGHTLDQCSFLSLYDAFGVVLLVDQPQTRFIALLEAGRDYIYAFDPLIGIVLYPC